MSVIVRALGLGLAAVAGYLLMTFLDDGEGGANIGAGLSVFGILIAGGFTWAGLDAISSDGTRGQRVGLGALLLRWVLVSVLAVAVLMGGMVLRNGKDYLTDLEPSSLVFLVLLALVPSVVGTLLGYAARGNSSGSAGRTHGD